MVLLRALGLLALAVLELHCLPWTIQVSESQQPGTSLLSFYFNCSTYIPALKLLRVIPPTTFFNPPSLTRWQGNYLVEMTLSSSARLDALAVNHYELELQFICGNSVVNKSLFVHVHRDLSHVRCASRFASPAGGVIQVLETVTPGAPLYTLLLPDLEPQRVKISITSAQDPPYFPGPFSINELGWLRAPPQGLKGQASKVFQLQVFLNFGVNGSCQGMLKVKVLPVPSSQVSFPKQYQNRTILEDTVPGSQVIQVKAKGVDVRYEILSPVPCPFFSIGHVDGIVRTTVPLDLTQTPSVAVTRLKVKAFERLRPWDSDELELIVEVEKVNHWPPHCYPALLVTQIPEDTPVGTVLSSFTCTDPDSLGSTLDYQLLFHNPPDSGSFCLQGRVLEVNDTLDCDIPGVCFQHAASILVLDNGHPLMSTEVPVLVVVTAVNEFSPACVAATFRVPEDAEPHTPLGTVVGTDRDHPHNSIEYYLSGSSTIFAVDRISGEVLLLRLLDYEQQRLHRLTILLIDQGQDQDPNHHLTGSCTITIDVEDVNEHAPECEPPFQELTIHAPLGHSVEVTKVSCRIPQEPQRQAFSYSIIEGNSQSLFSLKGAVLIHNDLILRPFWLERPQTYELLIRVTDAGPINPHFSTTATVIVHLVPWRTTTVAMSTRRVTTLTSVTPLLVVSTETFWEPEPWFVVVLTVTGALLLLALGWLLSRLLQRLNHTLISPGKPEKALLLNSIQGTGGSMEVPKVEMPQAPNSFTNLHFDGRAQDSQDLLREDEGNNLDQSTGREYLFNTDTGARRWL